MLDVSEIVTDPDFAKEYTVYRSSGFFGEGGWIENEKAIIPNYGAIFPTKTKDLIQVPEGDRIDSSVTFYSVIELFTTKNENATDAVKRTSDLLEWKNEKYKIVKLLDFSDFGYYKAITVRIAGD